MDRSWMYQSRLSNEYLNGVIEFLNFAFGNASVNGKITCPCVKCGNGRWVTRNEEIDHLVYDGFINGYTEWIAHGEGSSSTTNARTPTQVDNDWDMQDNMHELLYDTFGLSNRDVGIDDVSDDKHRPNENAESFYKLLGDSEQPLYPGCKKFSKLSFLVQLFHLKCLGNWTNKSFTMLLELLKRVLPEGETLPKSYYESRKIMGELGLTYDKINDCHNDIMLYWKERTEETKCHICQELRYKTAANNEEYGPTSSKKAKKVPRKVLLHFPLKPRLQRLYVFKDGIIYEVA